MVKLSKEIDEKMEALFDNWHILRANMYFEAEKFKRKNQDILTSSELKKKDAGSS